MPRDEVLGCLFECADGAAAATGPQALRDLVRFKGSPVCRALFVERAIRTTD